MSIEKFLIENNVLEEAQQICSVITNNFNRSRGVANIIASKCAASYFKQSGIEIDIESGMHNIPKILEDIEISDIYLNNAYIDVRLCKNEQELNVPVSHFKNDIIPSAYMFIKIAEDLSSFEVLGFVLPEGIERDNETNGYYMIDPSSLLSFDEINEYIEGNVENEDVSDLEIFKYLENSLDNFAIFIKKLIHNKTARQKLLQYYNAQNIFNFVSKESDEPKKEEIGKEFDKEPLQISDDNSLNENDIPFSSFEYTTVTTPSLDLSLEENSDQNENNFEVKVENNSEIETVQELDIVDEEPSEEESVSNEEYVSENINIPNTENTEIVENLFIPQQDGSEEDFEPYSDGDFDINAIRAKQNKKPLIILVIVVIAVALAGIGGYLLFAGLNNSKTMAPPPQFNENTMQETVTSDTGDNQSENQSEEVMPVESVEKPNANNKSNEGNAIQVPEIEKSLDASVLVSNLKIDWEVPVGYASNTAATRYFIKLGKIIQLNLKTELLLLNKPPLSNRIAVEIKYNNSEKSFEAVGITTSSGEKTIDDLVLQIVKKALKMKLNSNLDSFGKISGNPVLIIKL